MTTHNFNYNYKTMTGWIYSVYDSISFQPGYNDMPIIDTH